MISEGEDGVGHHGPRERTLSSMSQQSSMDLKFPLAASDSGLYTCSSNNSDYLESDTESFHLRATLAGNNDALQLALHEGRRLRSELERLTKSEQWYKQELRQQKTSRLEDLEKIYTQERKFMQENQRLQKECVRLYDKCSELEKATEKQHQDLQSTRAHCDHPPLIDDSVHEFQAQQQSACIRDQQMLIEVLRKQKQDLLEDLKCLNVNKDEKVMEMQRLLADLEYDNKLLTKRCAVLSKGHSKLENKFKQTDAKLYTVLDEKLNLQKTLVEMQKQLAKRENDVKLKEDEIASLQENFRQKMLNEEDLDEVHSLSLKYHEEIISKSLEIKTLKNQISCMQMEIENYREILPQNEQQQRLIEQLKFSLETCKVELQEIRQTDVMKTAQIAELQKDTEKMLQDKAKSGKEHQRQQKEFADICQELKTTKDQYAHIQQLYNETKFKLELLGIENGKLQFEKDNDQKEISHLRQKLTEYLQQTSELSKRIQELQFNLNKSSEEKETLKYNFKEVQNKLENVERQNSLKKPAGEEIGFIEDYDELSNQCERLQSNLDACSSITKAQSQELINSNIMDHPIIAPNSTDEELTVMFHRLQENAELLRRLLKEKETVLAAVNTHQNSNKDLANLVNENEILKKKIVQIESEATILQLKQDLGDMTRKSALTEDLLAKQKQKVEDLQKKLLANDAKLYKLERNRYIKQSENECKDLEQENVALERALRQEQAQKTELEIKLGDLSEQVAQMTDKLEQLKTKGVSVCHKAMQCDMGSTKEVENLKEQLLDFQEKERRFHATESERKEERIQLLQKIAHMQESKLICIQDRQKDWEDMLNSLNTVQANEEETRRQLELKRRELEELNQVFEAQNQELRKLEGLTVLIESKRRKETQKLNETFQQEMSEMRQELQECRHRTEEEHALNLELQTRLIQIQRRGNEGQDSDIDMDGYKTRIISLNSKVEQSESDKLDLLDRIQELEEELKNIKSHQRQAILMPQLTESCSDVNKLENHGDLEALKSNVSEDHLRILTKVLEAEYDRKMQRYDQHIHSLLLNVRALKKSLRLNLEKTALLEDEQTRTVAQLDDLQRTKRKFDDMRSKYEQSQNTIEELKEALALERRKFESSDLGKATKNQVTTYEVSNLIDDYKKLIQQSAVATKRPTTCAVLDLIERSNQCVPNLHKLESNLVELRNDFKSFLSLYAHKIPANNLINTASLTLPPSLMDELRAASEGY